MVNKKNYFCPLCLKEFGNKKDNYQKHLNKTGCGIGIIKLEEMKIENEKKDIDIFRLKEEDKKLKEENEKLKEENDNLKNQIIVNNKPNITNI